jgi:hypothetical protein
VKAEKGKVFEVKLVKAEKEENILNNKTSWSKLLGEENNSKLIKNISEEGNLESEEKDIVFNGEKYGQLPREEVKATPEELNSVYQDQDRLKGSDKELLREVGIGGGIVALITGTCI